VHITIQYIFICSIIIILRLLLFFIIISRFVGNEGLPDILHDSAGDPLSPKPNNHTPKSMFVSQKNRKDGGSSLKAGMEAVRMSMLNRNSLGSSYDRSHITGSTSLSLKNTNQENI